MSYIGDYSEDFATLNFKFTTVGTDGAPTTLAGTPVISVYKADGLVQSTAGVTLTVDFDAVTGLNNVLINLAADAFYAVANDYHVVITTGTVGGTSVVGYVVAQFSIENRFMRGTDSAALASIATEARLAELDAANLPSDVDAILVDTGTTLQAELDGIQADTENIQTRLPAALVGGRMDSTIDATGFEDAAVDKVWDEAKSGHVGAGSFGEEVQAHALSSEITALNDLSATQVNTEVSDVLKTDTIAELAQQAPPTAPTFQEAMMYLYMALVHKVDITATLKEFHNNAGTVIYKKTLSDDGTTYTEAESVAGP